MKRDRATALLEDMFGRLDAGGWPLDLVDEIYVFGSYVRGALDPHDVDVDVEHRRDERLVSEMVGALSYGRDPMASMKWALKARSRGLEIQFGQRQQLEEAGIPVTLLWRRDEEIARAKARIAALVPDPTAGRADRHDMIEPFEGLDRWIPRPVRGKLIEMVEAGAITIDRVELPDATPRTPEARRALGRWTETSPLRRAAAATLSYLEASGRDLVSVRLHGELLSRQPDGLEADPELGVGFGWRYFDDIVWQLTTGTDWMEIVRPTRKQPLHALHIVVRDRQALPSEFGI